MTQLLLVGNPNCGKTTLFNALTGANQRVGNWPGVTVEKKTGSFALDDKTIQLTDIPGIYSLSIPVQGLSQDEHIAVKAIAAMEPDCILNVLDACYLERHLYLTSQLLELGRPLVVVLTMMDVAQQRGIVIDVDRLAKELGCPVIPVQAHKGIGMMGLSEALRVLPDVPHPLTLVLEDSVTSLLGEIESKLLAQGKTPSDAYYQARRLAEADSLTEQGFNLTLHELDILLADARYQKINLLVSANQTKKSDASEHFTAKLDKIVLHRVLALPIFLLLMYFMFLFAINVGGAFQDFFDISSELLFVQGSARLLNQLNAPNWLIGLIANGVGKGINTTLTFIPVIAGMFFFLSLLETSGYMARAAFVVDKAMRAMGLPGKSFVPMIVGFGCNVPAIMAARTLDSERDRMLTVMMSPFMSCSARLAIYAVFVAAFFPSGGANVVFSLYLIGILMAVLTGFILSKVYFKGQSSPLILELPAYHKPSLKRLLKETNRRLSFFVVRAGKLIIPICVALGGLNAITLVSGVNTSAASPQSLLALLGQWLTPVFSPMGISQENWPATVGLLTGMLAKEVVIGTLNGLYTSAGQLAEAAVNPLDFWGGINLALWSIPHNIAQLGGALVTPIAARVTETGLNASAYGMMVERFNGAVGAYAYLLFVLLYIPCVSTMAVIRQETTRQLMWVSVIWSLLIAYSTAVLFYQGATFLMQSNHSIWWVSAASLSFGGVLAIAYWRTLSIRRTHVTATT